MHNLQTCVRNAVVRIWQFIPTYGRRALPSIALWNMQAQRITLVGALSALVRFLLLDCWLVRHPLIVGNPGYLLRLSYIPMFASEISTLVGQFMSNRDLTLAMRTAMERTEETVADEQSGADEHHRPTYG